MLTTGYAIARARPRDVPHLAAIELSAAQLLQGYAPDSILQETTSDDEFRAAQTEERLWVALAGDAPVGFALVEFLDNGRPHLEEIDVDPRHGRQGLGTALVRAVCEWVSGCGYEEITLTTFRAVPWNMPFYERLGFEVVPSAVLNPALAAVVEDEAHRGLDPVGRVVMRYRVCAPASPL